jgi:hypothetical protein
MPEFREFKGHDGKIIYVNRQMVAGLISEEGSNQTEVRFAGSAVFVAEPIDKVKNDLG